MSREDLELEIEKCNMCDGTGKDDETFKSCDVCQGTGKYTTRKIKKRIYSELEILIMQALARGYCSKENENKTLDSTLIYAMVKECLPAIMTWHKQQMEEEEQKRYWSPCEGCKDGHSSFWKTVTKSPQWKLWQKEQSRRVHLLCLDKLPKDVRIYDMPECEETGWISQGHFQEFVKFISAQREVELLEGLLKDYELHSGSLVYLIQQAIPHL